MDANGCLVHILNLVLNDIENQSRSKAASYHGRDGNEYDGFFWTSGYS